MRVELAHIGKLQQILRRAFHIRAAVDQERPFPAVRDHRAKAGAADTADTAYRERSAAEKSAGAPGGNDGVALSAVEHLERNGHRRVRLFARGSTRIILHRNDVRRVHDLNMLAGRDADLLQAGKDLRFTADKRHIHMKLA